MKVHEYFTTDKKQPRLIDLAILFYLIDVVLYTADDFKQPFPGYMILMGLVMHSLFLMVIIHRAIKLRIPRNLLGIIEKLLPFGLMMTYSLSYKLGVEKGLGMRGIAIFLVPTIPVLLFYCHPASN